MKPSVVKRFHADLSAALVADVPIALNSGDSSFRSRVPTQVQLDDWESVIERRLAQNESLTQIFESQSGLPVRYRAALQVFDQTESMEAVLDGLMVGALARRQLSRILRWAFGYLLIVLAVMIGGLWLFVMQAVPAVDEMRADLLLPAAINAPQRIDVTAWYPTIVVFLGISLGLMLVALFTGGATKVAIGLGGRHFIRCRTSLVTVQIVQLMVAHGADVTSAAIVSCDLTNADDNVRRDVLAAVQAAEPTSHLRGWTDYLKRSANERLTHLQGAAPIALVAIAGGCMALVYCLAIYGPIIALLKDLSTAGT